MRRNGEQRALSQASTISLKIVSVICVVDIPRLCFRQKRKRFGEFAVGLAMKMILGSSDPRSKGNYGSDTTLDGYVRSDLRQIASAHVILYAYTVTLYATAKGWASERGNRG